METPADMSQLQHAEEYVGEDSMANGDPLKTDMSQLLHAQKDSLASGDLPADLSQLQHAREESLEEEDGGETHWPVDPPLADISQLH